MTGFSTRTLVVAVLLFRATAAHADATDDYVRKWMTGFRVPGLAIAVCYRMGP